jgi:hypothetical protein
MMRKEFVAICVEHNIKYDIDPKTRDWHGTISIEAPKGKVFAGSECHYHDYDVCENMMAFGYDAVVENYIGDGVIDCPDPDCDCHDEPDRPAVVPETPKPVVHKSTHPEVIEEKVVWSETGVKNGVEYKHAQRFIFNDGGREAAGYKGSTGDCVTRSIAIVTGRPYKEVYDAINQLSESERTGKRKKKKSNARTGVFKGTSKKYLLSLGYEWIPTMQIGQGCKVHLRSDELPTGRIIVKVSKHMTTMIDGVINDTHDCSRQGTRCVYGYFRKKIAD